MTTDNEQIEKKIIPSMVKVKCPCGGKYIQKSRKSHFTTQKHKNWEKSGNVKEDNLVKNISKQNLDTLSPEEQDYKRQYMKDVQRRHILKKARELSKGKII